MSANLPPSYPSSAPGAPPPYAFVARVYRRPLRPIVLACTSLAALWSFIWGISALNHLPDSGDLKPINIALGSLYLVIGVIELFGIIAAFKQIIGLVRAFAFLSVFAAVTVVAAEILRFSTYFSRKKLLIDRCTEESTGETFTVWNGGFWGSRGTTQTLNAADAAKYCKDSWSRSVWSSVAWLLVATLIGWFLVSLAFSYYHQILSPQQIPPSQAYAMGNFGMNNPNQPYNPSAGYHYPAPSGPPPQQQEYVPPYDPAKLPEYGAGSYGASTASVGDVKAGGQANSSREDVSFHSPAAPGRNA